MRTSFRRAAARAALITLGVATLSLTGAFAASAHVSLSPDTTAAGSSALVTLSVPHGCDGSATTRVAIKIPDQLTAVTPTVNPGWDVEKVTVPLNPPVTDAHGNQLTERVDQVVYTAKTPLPDGFRDTFTLSFQIPDIAGQTLAFPTIQTCEAGETAWIEPVQEGEDEPDHPAPAFVVTAGGGHAGESHGTGSSLAATPDGQSGETSEAAAQGGAGETGGASAVAVIGLIVAVLALAVGSFAVLRSRRA